MDQNLIYAKTPSGDEAVRQSTRVVQRNLRMVLVQVDGKLTVAELATKIGNPKLVEKALRELEEGGFIAPVLEAASVWEEAKRRIAERVSASSPASQFSTFGPKSLQGSDPRPASDFRQSGGSHIPSVFSTFGRPILPADEPAPAAPRRAWGETLDSLFARPGGEGRDTAMPLRFRPAMLVWGLLAILVLAAAGLFFYPYNNFRPELQAALSRALLAPVRIDNIGFVVTPRPGLVVQGISVGEDGGSRIEEIRLPSPLALFGSSHKILTGLEMRGVKLSADRLGGLAAIPVSGPPGIIIGDARLRDVTISAHDLVLRDLGGAIFFKPAGGLDKLSLQSEDRTLRIEALPSSLGLALSIEGLGWKPAADAPYVFESLQAKGVLQKGKLVLQDIDTSFMGGLLRGSFLLDWNKGLVMAADAALTRLNGRRVGEVFAAPLKLDGELGGSIKLRGAADDWPALWAGVEGSMDVEVTRGTLFGVDLGEAARRGAGRTIRGGQTKFDSLKGYLRIGPQQVSGSEVHLFAGLMTADGQFVARRDGNVDGAFTVKIASSASALRVPVRISGQLPDLTTAAGNR